MLGSAVTLALLLVFGAWFFFFRTGSTPIVPVPPPPRPAVGKVITYADYRQAINDALGEVRNALNASGDDRKAAVTRAIADLDRVEGAAITGRTGGLTVAEADNTLLLAELQGDAPNLEAVQSSLTILSAGLSAEPTTVNGTLAGAEARAALSAVLADPLYDYTKTESPLQKLLRWLASITGTSDPNEVLARLLLSAVVGGVVGALVFLLLGTRVRNRWARLGISFLCGLVVSVLFFTATNLLDLVFVGLAVAGLAVAAVAAGLFIAGLNRASTPSTARAVSDLEVVLGMGAQEARKRAAASASEGDYRAAIRYRCLAVLLALDEAGMLVFDRSATNREYLFRAPGPIYDDLQGLLSRFEAIWYGNSPTNAAEWAQYDARASSIEDHIISQRKAKAA
jgi:hypothetical protein